jgi:hypothetical protein
MPKDGPVVPPPHDGASIGPGGGTYRITDPKNPLYGLSISLPPGAVDSATTISVSSTQSGPAPEAIRTERLGDFIAISKDTLGDFHTPVEITLPIGNGLSRRTGVVIFSYNEQTGIWDVPPITGIDFENKTITVTTSHLSLYQRALVYPAEGVLDTGFVLSEDSFPYANQSVFAYPGVCWGITDFTRWYFTHDREPPLRRCGLPESNLLYMAGQVQGLFTGLSTLKSFVDSLYGLAQGSIELGVASSSIAASIYAALALTGKPQPLALYTLFGEGHSVLAYKWDGTGIHVFDSNCPDLERIISFNGLSFDPYESGGSTFILVIKGLLFSTWYDKEIEAVYNRGATGVHTEDDFEDGVIDDRLWSTGGEKRSYTDEPGGPWSFTAQEIQGTDGYLELRSWGPETGNTYGAESWVRTAYNYNDGNRYLINFVWQADAHDSHYNHYLIQITDGYVPPLADLHWPMLEVPGTVDLLWGTDLSGQAIRGIYLDGSTVLPGQKAWSIAIDPSGMARMYSAFGGGGSCLHEAHLDRAKAWYVRFMISDGTSQGCAPGDARLRLYNLQEKRDLRPF